jgi:hypothetical protein
MAEGRLHGLVVDAQDVDGDLLRVSVVREAGDELVVELPRPTLSGGSSRCPGTRCSRSRSAWKGALGAELRHLQRHWERRVRRR